MPDRVIGLPIYLDPNESLLYTTMPDASSESAFDCGSESNQKDGSKSVTPEQSPTCELKRTPTLRRQIIAPPPLPPSVHQQPIPTTVITSPLMTRRQPKIPPAMPTCFIPSATFLMLATSARSPSRRQQQQLLLQQHIQQQQQQKTMPNHQHHHHHHRHHYHHHRTHAERSSSVGCQRNRQHHQQQQKQQQQQHYHCGELLSPVPVTLNNRRNKCVSNRSGSTGSARQKQQAEMPLVQQPQQHRSRVNSSSPMIIVSNRKVPQRGTPPHIYTNRNIYDSNDVYEVKPTIYTVINSLGAPTPYMTYQQFSKTAATAQRNSQMSLPHAPATPPPPPSQLVPSRPPIYQRIQPIYQSHHGSAPTTQFGSAVTPPPVSSSSRQTPPPFPPLPPSSSSQQSQVQPQPQPQRITVSSSCPRRAVVVNPPQLPPPPPIYQRLSQPIYSSAVYARQNQIYSNLQSQTPPPPIYTNFNSVSPAFNMPSCEERYLMRSNLMQGEQCQSSNTGVLSESSSAAAVPSAINVNSSPLFSGISKRLKNVFHGFKINSNS